MRTPATAAAIRERLEAGVLAARERQADDDSASVRATLEAICTSEADAVDFFRFPGAEERLSLDSRGEDESERPMVGPSGSALLEAILQQ